MREKKLKKGRRSLYLDFYPPIVHPDTHHLTRREHLRLYIYEKPKSELEREHNKETKMLGANICAQRQLEFQSGSYGFVSARAKRRNFIDYFRSVCESKKDKSVSTQRFWEAILAHLITFTGGTVAYADITESFCNNFKRYLISKCHQNTASIYFSNFQSALSTAANKKLLNPVHVKNIEKQETGREYLTLAELKTLLKTDCRCAPLKQAAIFSAFTGLRFSDILKLRWSEVQFSDEQGGYFIHFRQRKTGGLQILPISDEAREILGMRSEGLVIKGLGYWQCSFYLSDWIKDAKIGRHITFHSFRHSFAVIQLSMDTDIYTVSKMLGHKNLATTENYAKVLSQAKRTAANKISLKDD